jgi:hypothetical protein
MAHSFVIFGILKLPYKYSIQGVSKLNGKTSGMDSSYRDEKRVYNMGPEMYDHRVVRAFIY